MPGQQLIAPHLTSEAVAAQTSPQAKRRRATRLLKTGSFCSISSEGDGDIFGDVEAEIEAASSGSCFHSRELALSQPRGSTSTGSSGKFDPLSDYSEFHNDDACSDISDLFLRPVTASPPEDVDGGGQPLKPLKTFEAVSAAVGTSTAAPSGVSDPSINPATMISTASHLQQSVNAQKAQLLLQESGNLSETGSIDDITYEVPTVVTSGGASGAASEVKNNMSEKDQDVSSCSLSIGSEDNNTNQNQLITVPVTIEHPPPEMRVQPQRAEAACQQVTPASIAHHREQQTLVAPSSDNLDNRVIHRSHDPILNN